MSAPLTRNANSTAPTTNASSFSGTEQGRIMATFNVKDFARIATEWAAARRSRAGCLLIVGIDHAEFELILRVIDHALTTRAQQAAWIDYTAWGVRSATT
jgi:hypothetical protein